MALDLGLAKRPRTRRLRNHPTPPLIQDYEPQRILSHETSIATPAGTPPDSSTIECRRTLLACYLQCASVSLSLRLPNALRFTSYMGECLDVLENSPEAAPTDRRFAAWIRIQRIVDECVNSFSLDDPEITVSLTDVRVQNQLRGYEKQMEEWRNRLEPGTSNGFLDINFHVTNVYMHEISLHPDHEPEDFRPPFYVTSQLISKIPTSMNPVYVDAIMECVSSAQAVLSTFVGLSISTIRALPAQIFVRTIYCIVILIKLDISSRAPASELGKVLDSDTLGLPAHFQKVLSHQMDVVGSDGRHILAVKFLLILKRLIGWYQKYRSQLPSGGRGQDTLEPGPLIDPERYHELQVPPAVQPQPSQGMLQQSKLPDFGALPPSVFQPFSRITHPPPPRAFTGFGKGPEFTTATDIPEQEVQQASYDYHQAMLAANTDSPSADYSSPEYSTPNTGNANAGVSTSPPFEYNKMEVDPNIFGQLQGMGEPFTYNPDPNDWMFDGGTGMGTGLEGLGFDWGNIGMQ